MLWIFKMLIETPRAVWEYRKDYYNSKKIRATIKRQGVVAGFYQHDTIYGSSIQEWLAVCEYLDDAGKEIPQGMLDMALERGWIAMKPLNVKPPTTSNEDWKRWENE